MRLSAAISGFLLFKEAAGLRPNTLTLYRYHLSLLAAWLGDDPTIEAITTEHLTAFLAYMRSDYQPRRTNGDDGPLASQSIYNIWTALKSFYKWLAATLDLPDAMADIPRPKARNVEQQPFTQEEVKRLLTAAAPRKRKRATTNVRYINELRDQAILLTLLDTGLRAGELAALVVGDLHLQSGRLDVRDGKGGKSRTVWLGAHARPLLWRYLQERREIDPAAPLFLSGDRPLSRSWLRKRLVRLGEVADVAHVYPHRFRHTFAIQYLRNGGDVFTLQALLGHSTLTMVQRYLKLAAADVAGAHRRASPVDNWLK